MRILNTTRGAIIDAATECGCRADVEHLNPSRGEGDTFRVKLYPDGTDQRKLNPYTGRRANAVCWHGFRDFYRALFELSPGARVRSALAHFNGPAHFEATYQETGSRNVGSMMYPYTMAEACDCPDAGLCY